MKCGNVCPRSFSLFLLLVCVLSLSGCSKVGTKADWTQLSPVSEMKLDYAQQFSVTNYEDGYRVISVAESSQYLLVPEGAEIPENLPENLTVLQQPISCIYLAATSAMDLFRSLDAIGSVRLSGTDASGWYIPEAKQALADGTMLYAGKYSTPDYELILSEGCDFAIESTMILHSPEVKEQLERLSIPVFVERSSYEKNPLGRMEWLKLYGVLLNKEDLAEQVFNSQLELIRPVLEQERTDKTVAFFYVTPTGAVNVRKSGDYIAETIRLAGGEYVFSDLSDNGNDLSTMNIQMETFYAAAKDADILIYNSTIYGEVHTLAELSEKCELFADYKAVQEGKVYCTSQNLFQDSMGLGDLLVDMHTILTEENPQSLKYLYRLT